MVDLTELVRHAFQEIGMIGRRQDATYLTDVVEIVITAGSYLILLHHLNFFLVKSSSRSKEKKKNREREQRNMLKSLQLFVLDFGCMKAKFENEMVIPTVRR